MSDAEARHDAEDPAQSVTPYHSDGDLLKGEDDSCAEGSKDKVYEQSNDLGSDVGREDEGRDVSERHDCRWEQQEQHPHALIKLSKGEHKEDDQANGDIGHQDVKDEVGHPIAGQ